MRKPPGYLIEHILHVGTFAVLFSAPNVGKSFVALDMAFHVAAGLPWMGYRTKQAGVVYIIGEGLPGMGNRVRAWRTKHDVPQRTNVGVQVRFWDRDVQFGTELGRAQFALAMDEAATALGSPPGLIIVDTLASCNTGKDENSVEDMTKFLSGVQSVRPSEATILVLHHEGRKKGHERGSTALGGAIDTKLYLQRMEGEGAPQNGIVLSCAKQREEAEFDPIAMLKTMVPLPDGETSVVLERAEWEPDAPPKISDEWKLAVVRLRESGMTGMRPGDWRSLLDMPRRSFFRMKKALMDQGLIVELDNGNLAVRIAGEENDGNC